MSCYVHSLQYPSCEWFCPLFYHVLSFLPWRDGQKRSVTELRSLTVSPPLGVGWNLLTSLSCHAGLYSVNWNHRSLQWRDMPSLLLLFFLPPSTGRHLLQRQTSSLQYRRRQGLEAGRGGVYSVTSSVHIWAWSLHAAGNPLTGADEWGGGPRELPKCI